MKYEKAAFIPFFERVQQNRTLLAIRSGMMLAIPAIMAGSLALLLLSFPVAVYQDFIGSAFGGILYQLLGAVRDATLEAVSLIILLTISFSFEKQGRRSHLGTLPFVSVCSYLAFSLTPGGRFSAEIFRSTHLFNAILVSVLSAHLYGWLERTLPLHRKGAWDSADSVINETMLTIAPALLTILCFALLNVVITEAFGVKDFQLAFSGQLLALFDSIGRTLFGALLFIFLLHLMWFFGIHGGNVLDEVAKTVFESGTEINQQLLLAGEPATELFSKTFFDTFVVFGGCGALLCLVGAIFLCDRRRGMRRLSEVSLLPVLFNMNELMLFGVPIVLNPIYFIPFLLTPIVLTLVSFFAMSFGIVPLAAHPVEWTTPIFVSGYAATGSVAGSLLQLVNLITGVLLYLPFVKFSQAQQARRMKRQLGELTQEVQKAELQGVRPLLFKRNDQLASLAELLADDLRFALKSGGLELFYQPQANPSGEITGAEALLRWEHETGGYLYPPLVIALAREGDFLDSLSEYVVTKACQDLCELQSKGYQTFELSLNLSPDEFYSDRAIGLIGEKVRELHIAPGTLGVEITEQAALSNSSVLVQKLELLHSFGAQVIMDDFGMGHSSMVYLQNGRFDVVKLDGSLVRDITQNQRSRDIVSSILALSHTLGFDVIAEFVETKEQQSVLEALGCGEFQGYLYSPAVRFTELSHLLTLAEPFRTEDKNGDENE